MVHITRAAKAVATWLCHQDCQNAFHKRALRYHYQEKTQTLYRIIKKKDTGESNLSLMPFNFLFNQSKLYYNRNSWPQKMFVTEIIDDNKFSLQSSLWLLSQIPWCSETSWGRCTMVLVPWTCPKHCQGIMDEIKQAIRYQAVGILHKSTLEFVRWLTYCPQYQSMNISWLHKTSITAAYTCTNEMLVHDRCRFGWPS